MRISDWSSDVCSSDLSDEQSAGRSWPRSRAAPLEQRYAKPSFQQLYPARDCRLRYVKCSRRTPKASMFRDDNCISQIPKVEGDIRHRFLTPRQRTANKHRWARTNWLPSFAGPGPPRLDTSVRSLWPAYEHGVYGRASTTRL